MLTPKENYLQMLRGEIPEYIPSGFEPYSDFLWVDDFATPAFAPRGFAFNPWGVRFVGSRDLGNGALPEPGRFILKDITKWRDVIKNPDIRNVDFEAYYKKDVEGKDRKNIAIVALGGDYFQTLVSFMGFEEAMLAMVEEPDEVIALNEYLSEYNLEVLSRKFDIVKPDVYMIADDCAAARTPFFSPE
ncbi:MAG: veratrol--corrinoid protein metyltransferase, partial [Oscillospiraceae bacterium]|nr:veratrol--corrinoid protein metyltransferase [Oscillospiraceae bacterium]